MRITYSPAADAMAIDLLDALTARMVKLAPNVNADFDAGGRLSSIEILNASAWYPKAELEQLASPVTWLTLKEAAAAAAKEGEPISPDTLRSQIAKKKLLAEKRGSDWVIAEHELWNYLERRAPAGRRAEGSVSRGPGKAAQGETKERRAKAQPGRQPDGGWILDGEASLLDGYKLPTYGKSEKGHSIRAKRGARAAGKADRRASPKRTDRAKR